MVAGFSQTHDESNRVKQWVNIISSLVFLQRETVVACSKFEQAQRRLWKRSPVIGQPSDGDRQCLKDDLLHLTDDQQERVDRRIAELSCGSVRRRQRLLVGERAKRR